MLHYRNSSEYVPLARRIYTTKPSKVPQPSTKEFNRPTHYKLWTEEKIRLACDAVRVDGYTYRRAELEYGVPKSTIRDRISGRTLPGATSGPERYLTEEEEKELTHFIKECAKVGYAKTRKQIIAIVDQAVKDKRGPDSSITAGWWYSFKSRHPHLSIRTAEQLAYSRAVAQDQTVLDHYFELLERTLVENELIGLPSRIFNVDESGFPLQGHQSTIIAEKGCKHPTTVTTGDKAQITVIACVSASGANLPPLVIFDRKVLKVDLTLNEVPETIYALTDNGWSNSEVFDIWFNNHFLMYAPTARPLLLLMDGHSSHYNPSTIKTAAAQQVILFCLPPHTTHIAQPLDVGCFGVLKRYWDEECNEFMGKNIGKVVTRFQFSELFSRAWARAMIPHNICAGFKATGVYPLDSTVFTAINDLRKSPPPSSIKFVPMYSPIAPRSKRVLMCSEEEEEIYRQRYEDGPDLSSDPKFLSWLQVNHPDEAKRLCELLVDHTEETQQTSMDVIARKSCLTKLLNFPKPPSQSAPPHAKKPCAKVLTSLEKLKSLEAKEREKQENLELQERKRREREARKEEKARVAEEKKALKANNNSAHSLTPEEVELFERRYDNGYDVTIDSRYIMWLDSTHPEEAERLRSKDQSVGDHVGSNSTGKSSASSSAALKKSKPAPLRATKRCTIQKKTETSGKQGFSQQEVELFEKRYDNGYDLTIDSRHIMWLDSTHPEEAERLRLKDQPVANKDSSVSTAQKSDEFNAMAMKTKPAASVCDTEERRSVARRTRARTQIPTKQFTVQQNGKKEARTIVSTVKKGRETKVNKAVGANVPKCNTEAEQRITRSQTKKGSASSNSESLYQVKPTSNSTRGISNISKSELEDLGLFDIEDGKFL